MWHSITCRQHFMLKHRDQSGKPQPHNTAVKQVRHNTLVQTGCRALAACAQAHYVVAINGCRITHLYVLLSCHLLHVLHHQTPYHTMAQCYHCSSTVAIGVCMQCHVPHHAAFIQHIHLVEPTAKEARMSTAIQQECEVSGECRLEMGCGTNTAAGLEGSDAA